MDALNVGRLIAVVAWWLSSLIREGIKHDDLVAVDLGGTHHIGPDFNISSFYVNGANGFNVGREGGGGSSVCCSCFSRHGSRGCRPIFAGK